MACRGAQRCGEEPAHGAQALHRAKAGQCEGVGARRPGYARVGGARAIKGDWRAASTGTWPRTAWCSVAPEKPRVAATGVEGGAPAARQSTHCRPWCAPAAALPSGALPPSAGAVALHMPPKSMGCKVGAATATPMANTNHARTRRASVRERRRECSNMGPIMGQASQAEPARSLAIFDMCQRLNQTAPAR